MNNNWAIPQTIPQLLPQEIHIWRIFIPNYIDKLDKYWQYLNTNEQQKAKQFIQPKHQHRYIITHSILRQILAEYLTISPTDVNFVNNEFGKPQISDVDKKKYIHFNISHSNEVALLAFTKDCLIGIDVEFRRKITDIPEITKRFFTIKEHNTIISTSNNDTQLEMFFNYWTCKEAFIKAIGEGLNYPLNKLEIDIENLKIYPASPKYNKINWSLLKFEPFTHYSAALVTAEKHTTILLNYF